MYEKTKFFSLLTYIRLTYILGELFLRTLRCFELFLRTLRCFELFLRTLRCFPFVKIETGVSVLS